MIRAIPDWWQLRIRINSPEGAWVLAPETNGSRSRAAGRSAGWRGAWQVRRAADDAGPGIGTVQILKSLDGMSVHYRDAKLEVKGDAPFDWGGHTFRFERRGRSLRCDGSELAKFRYRWTSVSASDPSAPFREFVAVLAGVQVLYGLLTMNVAAGPF